MNEKRFSVRLRSECDGVVYSFFDGDKPIDVEMIVDLLNEQEDELKLLRATNTEQYEQIQRFQEEEKLYAQEILRLNELLKQYQSFKDLAGDY